MRRNLAALAAASMLALALGAAPALAANRGEGHGDQWWVTRDSASLFGMTVPCGANTYEVTHGTSDFVAQVKGTLDQATGEALTAGHGIETWTLNDVRVIDGAGTIHRVTGSQQIQATWLAGAYPYADPGGPFTSASRIVTLHVEGTTDGFSLVSRQLGNGAARTVTSGSCPNPFDG
jgi:hypothetical protein